MLAKLRTKWGIQVSGKLKKIWHILTDRDKRFAVLAYHGFYKRMDDETYLKRLFKIRTGYNLNLDNPKTFNEKLQWLKLNDRNPLYTQLVDKYAVKEYVANLLGNEYIIPTYGVWEKFDDIDFSQLPNQFVLKCTHDSGGIVICKDKSKLDIQKAKKILDKALKTDFYLMGREWPYKNVKRRIIAEKYMGELSGDSLTDYKLMCFNGKVKCTFTCTDRNVPGGLKVTFFDNSWKKLPIERHYPSDSKKIEKPQQFEQMKSMAEILAKDIPFVRIDFYEVQGKVFFGEMTFYPGAGFEEFSKIEYDIELGNMIQLNR